MKTVFGAIVFTVSFFLVCIEPDATLSDNQPIEPLLTTDTIPPVIKLLGGDTVKVQYADPNGQLNYYIGQVQATDNDSSPATKILIESTVDIFSTNSDTLYTIKYVYQDSCGNYATIFRYVYVYRPIGKDTLPPIINVSEPFFYIERGQIFIDPGVSVYDVVDGLIPSPSVIVTGTVNTAVIGEYVLTYQVADACGNIGTATRKVIVMTHGDDPDRVCPVITLRGSDTVKVLNNVKMKDFIVSYKDSGCIAIDNNDGDITAKVKLGDFTQVSDRVWYITYNVTDSAGNKAATVKRIFLTPYIGARPPIIDLVFPDSVIQLYLPTIGRAKWKEPGYSAYDLIDGEITGKVIVDSANLIAHLDSAGTYSVEYTVTNSGAVKATKIRIVQVVEYIIETSPPVITLKGKNPDTVVVGSATVYRDPGATAIHNRDGDITIKITVTGMVDLATVGKYSLIYSATSSAGLTGRATRIVYVISGALQ